MDVLERYVLEVQRFLPAKDADDVAEELRALLSDSLEARAAQTGRPLDERMVAETLRSFGDPETVADRYREPRYLIGPRLFPSFEYLAWIIAVAPALVGLFGHTVAVVMNDRPPLPSFGQLVTVAITYAGRTLTALGMAAIVFAILDRRLPSTWTRQDIEGGGRQWDPHSLPPLPQRSHSGVDVMEWRVPKPGRLGRPVRQDAQARAVDPLGRNRRRCVADGAPAECVNDVRQRRRERPAQPGWIAPRAVSPYGTTP